MILHTRNGAVVVINECCWTQGAYLAVDAHGGAGTILTVDELDQVRAELDRVAGAIADRSAPPSTQQEQAA